MALANRLIGLLASISPTAMEYQDCKIRPRVFGLWLLSVESQTALGTQYFNEPSERKTIGLSGSGLEDLAEPFSQYLSYRKT